MKKTQVQWLASSLAITVSLAGANAHAQQIEGNFNRDGSVSVSDRALRQFQPLGIPAGSFVFLPKIETAVATIDNVFAVQSPKTSDVFVQISPAADLVSNWSRHKLSAGFNADVIQYVNEDSENTTAWNLHASGVYDISSVIDIFGNATHAHSYEARDSFQADINTEKPISFDTDSASAGIHVTGNRLRFTGTASTSKSTFDDSVDKTTGAVIKENDRDTTVSTLAGRVDYAISPDLSIFVNVIGNKREYANQGSYSSSGTTFSIGTSFDLNHLARGEVEVGALSQNYEDSTVGKQTSGYFNAKVEYFPTELTSLTLNANRRYTDTPYLGNAVTALQTTVGMMVDHELLRNLILSGRISESRYQYEGIDRDDKIDLVMIGARYYMNRRTYWNANLYHEDYKSTGAAAYRNFTANVLRLNLVFAY